MTGTKARDVECPRCGSPAGSWCVVGIALPLSFGYHPERIKAAAAVTREANSEARRG